METEVLAPAGSIEGLKAALYAGADAVYTGGRMFGARAYANNLSDEELSECIDYCHLHNKKLYLTTNTLMKQSEIYQLADWLVPFYEQGLDAVIVQDFGAFAFLKREFPNLDLHASTQMSVRFRAKCSFIGKTGSIQSCSGKRDQPGGDRSDPAEYFSGNRMFCARGTLLLLFRSVSDEQYDRRTQREPWTLCTAVQTSLCI